MSGHIASLLQWIAEIPIRTKLLFLRPSYLRIIRTLSVPSSTYSIRRDHRCYSNGRGCTGPKGQNKTHFPREFHEFGMYRGYYSPALVLLPKIPPDKALFHVHSQVVSNAVYNRQARLVSSIFYQSAFS